MSHERQPMGSDIRAFLDTYSAGSRLPRLVIHGETLERCYTQEQARREIEEMKAYCLKNVALKYFEQEV